MENTKRTYVEPVELRSREAARHVQDPAHHRTREHHYLESYLWNGEKCDVPLSRAGAQIQHLALRVGARERPLKLHDGVEGRAEQGCEKVMLGICALLVPMIQHVSIFTSETMKEWEKSKGGEEDFSEGRDGIRTCCSAASTGSG